MARKTPARPVHPAGPQTGQRWFLLLAAVLAAAAGLRALNLIDIADSPFYTRPVIDGQAYDSHAQLIVKGDAPKEPFYQDPLYPYFLAFIYRLFGHSFTAVYVIQLLLAVVLVFLVFDTTRLLFDRRAGIAAAIVAALYKPFIFYESQIEKTALAVFLTGLFIWLLVRSLRSAQRPSNPGFLESLNPLLCGVALGLATLTRANSLLFAPLLPLVLALKPQAASRKLRIGAAAAGLLGVVLVIAPVSIRNTVLAREFTLTTTQAGQNLYIGNSPYNTTGQYQAPPWVRPNPEFEQADFAEYANKMESGSSPSSPVPHPSRLSYSAVSRFYTRAALDWARQNPAAYLKLLWRKTVLYFNDFEVPDNQDYYFFQRYSWVLRLPLFGFGVIFAFGLAGMVLLGRGLSRLSLAGFFLLYAASTIVFFIFSRYRVPSMPALLPFAGAMVFWLWDARDTRTRRFEARKLALGLGLCAAGFGLTAYPVHHGSGRKEAAQCLTNLASTFWREGDTARAVATFEEALATEPGAAEASRNLGIIMLGRRDYDRAFSLLSDAVASEPSNPVSHVYLGRIYDIQRRPEAAFLEFRKAVALAPGRVEYRFELARSMQETGDLRGALPQYDTMLQLAPGNAGVRHNYAVLLYDLGRIDDARVQLEEARRLGGPINPRFDSLLRSTPGTKR